MIDIQGLASLIFVVVLIFIALEVIHRTNATLLGVFFFMAIDVVHVDDIVEFLDLDILAVVLGLFLLVKGAEDSGIFQWMATRIMKSSKSPTAFAVLLLTFTVVLAVFVSNIGAMLIMASITITMAKSLKIKPQMLLIFQAIVINVGGMALWIGSIPNIIIGLEAGFSFNDFIVYMLPLGLTLYLTTLFIFIKMFKKDLLPQPEDGFRDLEFSEWVDRAIVVSGLDRARLEYKSVTAAVIMALTILGFILNDQLGLTPSMVAMGGGLLMVMVQSRNPAGILKRVDWSTILFLGCLFIMINGLEKIEVINSLAHILSGLLGDTPLLGSVALMWLSGFASSIVDNIPLSSSLAPVVKDMIISESGNVLWWGLIVGTNLGGNITPIGSPSNVITLGVASQEGYPISFNQFLKIGFTLSILYLVIASAYIVVRFGLM